MRIMKKLSWLAAILVICFYTGVEAAAAKPQSDIAKEAAIEIGKTHGIWGGFIDYAVLALGVIILLAVPYILYAVHGIEQRVKRLEKDHSQEVFYEKNSTCITFPTNLANSNDIDAMQEKINSLEQQVSSLAKKINAICTESRKESNLHTGIEETKKNDSLNENRDFSVGKWQSDTPLYDETKADKFRTDYNALYDMLEGIAKKNKKSELESNPSVIFFSCSNKDARRQNPNIKPTYARNEEKGDYIAYSIGGVHYAAIPAYTSYESTRHNEWAFGEVFDSNYTSGTYTKIKVEKPAIFIISDDRCTLKEKGNLVLSK